MNLNSYMDYEIDSEKFWKEGYLLIKNVFSVEEVRKIRNSVLSTLAIDKEKGLVKRYSSSNISYLMGDLLSKNLLRELVFDKRILDISRTLLNKPPVYFGYSSCQIFHAKEAKRPNRQFGWHKDNRLSDRTDRNGLDWHSSYPLIRFGIYLQDHAHKSGGLAVKLASHNTIQYASSVRKVRDRKFLYVLTIFSPTDISRIGIPLEK